MEQLLSKWSKPARLTKVWVAAGRVQSASIHSIHHAGRLIDATGVNVDEVVRLERQNNS